MMTTYSEVICQKYETAEGHYEIQFFRGQKDSHQFIKMK
jgi:hypothetical protein